MKRDIQVIRYVLEKIEKQQQSSEPIQITFNSDNDYSIQQLNYHISLLENAGLIDANIKGSKGHDEQINFVRSITWEGHDLLETLRNEEATKLAEEKAERRGSKLNDLPIEVTKSLLIASAKELFGLNS